MCGIPELMISYTWKTRCLKNTLIFITLFEPQTNLIENTSEELECSFYVSTTQMNKLSLRTIELLTQGHMTTNWQSQV